MMGSKIIALLIICTLASMMIITEAGIPEECNLKPETGRCRANIPRWAYNSKTGECEKFTYGGCDANANNFESPSECEKHCNVGGCGE